MTASLQKLPLVLGVVLGLLVVSGQADVDPRSAPLRAVFYPYRQGPAQAEGITPGLRLDRTTFELARAVLPVELLQYGLAGDFAVTVQPTTDMPLRGAAPRGDRALCRAGRAGRGGVEELRGGASVSAD